MIEYQDKQNVLMTTMRRMTQVTTTDVIEDADLLFAFEQLCKDVKSRRSEATEAIDRQQVNNDQKQRQQRVLRVRAAQARLELTRQRYQEVNMTSSSSSLSLLQNNIIHDSSHRQPH